MGAKKLYKSAHSSQETQAFYQAIGCVEAVEYNESLIAAEPYDCQLEYILLSLPQSKTSGREEILTGLI